MAGFVFEPAGLKDSYLITPSFVEDNRGFFVKTFENNIFAQNGISFSVSEDFTTCSSKNVIRGMHFQLYHPQTKLVSVLAGKIYDVIVDLRMDSPTFGQWRGFYLSAVNHKCLLVPPGFAHGFLSLSEDSLVNYKCDGEYDAKTDTGILYNDSEIGIEWPISDISLAVLGSRDKRQMLFSEFKEKCRFIY